MHSITLDIVADYGGITGKNDLAFIEVKRAFMSALINKSISCSDIEVISVSAFNTVETGFVVGQIATTSKLKNHVVFHNTAPRKDNTGVRKNNDGEFLAASLLPNGVLVIGPNSGHSFSFVGEMAPVYRIKCPTDGSQFRSRDVFPNAVAELLLEFMDGKITSIDQSQLCMDKINDLSPVPSDMIAYIDGYGNIKTTIRALPDLSQNNSTHYVTITINGVKETVKASKDGIFGIEEGAMVLAKGSSGEAQNNFYEIVRRGGSATQRFNHPLPGTQIVLSEAK